MIRTSLTTLIGLILILAIFSGLNKKGEKILALIIFLLSSFEIGSFILKIFGK